MYILDRKFMAAASAYARRKWKGLDSTRAGGSVKIKALDSLASHRSQRFTTRMHMTPIKNEPPRAISKNKRAVLKIAAVADKRRRYEEKKVGSQNIPNLTKGK